MNPINIRTDNTLDKRQRKKGQIYNKLHNKTKGITVLMIIIMYNVQQIQVQKVEYEVEGTKGVIRIRKSKTDREHNKQNKMQAITNNDLQNMLTRELKVSNTQKFQRY